jgi:dienelactone hydrolase
MHPRWTITNCWRFGLVIAIAITSSGQVVRSPGSRQPPLYVDHSKLMVVTDGRDGLVPVTSAADWDVRRAHILAHFQAVAGALPGGERRVPLQLRVISETKEPGLLRRKVSYACEPGDRVRAWLLIPDPKPREARKLPAVLCLHQTINIGKDEPVGLGANQELAYARELAGRGYIALAPDYPNFGEYHVDVYEMGYASATMKAIWNNMRAIDLLASLNEVDPDKIGAVGHSLGGHTAIFTALFESRIRAVVSSCGFNAFAYYYKGNIVGWSHGGYMPRLKERYGLDLRRVPFDFPELIACLAPRAFFTNSPLHDANFDVDGVRTCIAAAVPVYDLLGARDRLIAVYPDAQHAYPKSVRDQSYRFLDRALGIALEGPSKPEIVAPKPLDNRGNERSLRN